MSLTTITELTWYSRLNDSTITLPDNITALVNLYQIDVSLDYATSWPSFAGMNKIFYFYLTASQGLVTTLPDDTFTGMTALRYIRLTGNSTGLGLMSMPPSFASIAPVLSQISLSNNNLLTLPDVFGATCQLFSLQLSHNPRFNKLPASLVNCRPLTNLEMSYTAMDLVDSWPIFTTNNLRNFYADHTKATTLSEAFCSIRSQGLTLTDNAFSSLPSCLNNSLASYVSFSGTSFATFPEVLTSMPNLLGLQLGKNLVDIILPDNLVLTFPNLYSLSLSDTRMRGAFPTLVCPSLNYLQISGVNSLTSFPTTAFASLPSLTYFDLTYQGLNGTVPAMSGPIDTLNLAGNHFTAFSALPASLRTLDLAYNSFASLSTLPSLPSLSSIDLSYNAFSDFSSFSALPSSLGYLDFSYNALTMDSFNGGAHFSQLTNLRALNLAGNDKLTGTIPAFFFDDSLPLESLNLENCSFTGDFPAINTSNMYRIFVTNNSLDGTITMPIRYPALQTLRLGINSLHGSIPSAIFSTGNLQELSVKGNKLTGPIPSVAGTSYIGLLDLSDNDFDVCAENPLFNETDIHGCYMTGISFCGLTCESWYNTSCQLSDCVPSVPFVPSSPVVAPSFDTPSFGPSSYPTSTPTSVTPIPTTRTPTGSAASLGASFLLVLAALAALFL